MNEHEGNEFTEAPADVGPPMPEEKVEAKVEAKAEPKRRRTKKSDDTVEVYLGRCDWAGEGGARRWKGSAVTVTAKELLEGMDNGRYTKKPVRPLKAQGRHDAEGYKEAFQRWYATQAKEPQK